MHFFYKVTQKDTSTELSVGNFRLTHLKELLNDVVAEYVHHELIRCLQDLGEDQLPLRWTGPLQFQLDESAAPTKQQTFH